MNVMTALSATCTAITYIQVIVCLLGQSPIRVLNTQSWLLPMHATNTCMRWPASLSSAGIQPYSQCDNSCCEIWPLIYGIAAMLQHVYCQLCLNCPISSESALLPVSLSCLAGQTDCLQQKESSDTTENLKPTHYPCAKPLLHFCGHYCDTDLARACFFLPSCFERRSMRSASSTLMTWVSISSAELLPSQARGMQM